MPTYECDQCGACCNSLIVEIDELDLVREPNLQQVCKPLRIDPDQVLVDDDGEEYEPLLPHFAAGAMLAAGSAKPCPMLGDDNLCVIYPTRPTCCVAFRAGSDQCQMAREIRDLPPLELISERSER